MITHVTTHANIALFPGSFDPFTVGHMALALRALDIFDRLVVGIGVNPAKQGLLSPTARAELIRDAFSSISENPPMRHTAGGGAIFGPPQGVAVGRSSYGGVEVSPDDEAQNNRVEVVVYEGMTGDFCRARGIRHIVRGLRSAADFAYEQELEMAQRMLYPEITTVAMFTPVETMAVSSRLVREVMAAGGDPAKFLPENVDIKKYL